MRWMAGCPGSPTLAQSGSKLSNFQRPDSASACESGYSLNHAKLYLDEGASFAVFDWAGELEGFGVGDDIDTRFEDGGGEDGFVEVLEGVGAFHFEGTHRARQDDGDGELLVWFGVFDEGFVEPVAGFTQGVGAVEDDDSSAGAWIDDGVVGGGSDDEFDGVEDSCSVGVGEVEGVLLHELEGVDLGVF